jgi:hypothetical protein
MHTHAYSLRHLVCAVTHSCVTHVIYVGLSYIRRHEQRAHPQQLRHFGQPRNRLARRHRCLHLAGVPHYLRSVAATYYTATHCNTLQHTATHCHTLPHTATHCYTLPHTAPHRTTLPFRAAPLLPPSCRISPLPSVCRCNTPPHTAKHSHTLHHTIPHCHLARRHRCHHLCRVSPSLLVYPCHTYAMTHIIPASRGATATSVLLGLLITFGLSMTHICAMTYSRVTRLMYVALWPLPTVRATLLTRTASVKVEKRSMSE